MQELSRYRKSAQKRTVAIYIIYNNKTKLVLLAILAIHSDIHVSIDLVVNKFADKNHSLLLAY